MSPVTLEYFPIQGRGEAIRLMLVDQGIEFTDVGTENFLEKRANCSEYAFNQLPRLNIDGKALVQTNAILEYLSARAGQTPKDAYQQYQIAALQAAVEDFAISYTKAVYTPENLELLKTFATTTSSKFFSQFEALLSASTTSFIFSNSPSHPEYHLLYMVSCIETLRPAVFASEFPLLAAWYGKMLERKGIKAYFASGTRLEQRNGNKTADFAIC